MVVKLITDSFGSRKLEIMLFEKIYVLDWIRYAA